MKVIKQSATIPYSHMYDFPVGQNLLVTQEMRDLWSKVENALPDSVFNPDELEIEYCPKCGRRIEIVSGQTSISFPVRD